jgi:group II intron reverse transcriptase/maturase
MEPKEGTMAETLHSGSISTRLRRIAELARKHPERVFQSINHVIDMEFLKEAYRRTRKDRAAGVDRQTAAEYAANLEDNLQSLLARLRSGTYRAPPVRRVYIPKGDGRKTRPIGIPTFEDKVLQRVVTMVLEAIYEQDFLDCSYGFRPKRSQHQALKALRDGLMEMGGGWVLEVDIQSYFDTLDRSKLRSFLDQRVTDGVIRRVIHKWLKAGVMEEGAVWHPKTGTPQGGVISPLLSNIYLHEVLDVWFEGQVRPRLKGRAFLIRFADDVVMAFSRQSDAQRVLDVLPKRFGKYGLTLHPDKTRLVYFKQPRRDRNDDDPTLPGTFDMLGFTHHWAKSRRGYWVIKQRTARDRLTRALKRVRKWCRSNRHIPLLDQHRALTAKLRGHYNYYGITGNYGALARFYHEVCRAWHKWLGRRSHRAKSTWEWFNGLLARLPLPRPQVVHSVCRLSAKP